MRETQACTWWSVTQHGLAQASMYEPWVTAVPPCLATLSPSWHVPSAPHTSDSSQQGHGVCYHHPPPHSPVSFSQGCQLEGIQSLGTSLVTPESGHPHMCALPIPGQLCCLLLLYQGGVPP